MFAIASSVGAAPPWYALTPVYALKDNGHLLYFRHDDSVLGTPEWSFQGVLVGTDWHLFEHVFAGDAGTVYGIRSDGSISCLVRLDSTMDATLW